MSRIQNPPPTKVDWWHVDSKGRRIGWMWPEDFKISIDSIWGSSKGIAGFALYSGLSRTAVEGYANGKVPVTKQTALLVSALTRLVHRWRPDQIARGRTRDFPRLTAEWLPETTNKSKMGLDRRPFG